MKSEQKTVAMGAASGVILMSAAVWILSRVLLPPAIADMLDERLAYALRANVFAALPLFIMIVAVANARFLGEAIDPTRRAESRSMEINGRVADNTLQQNFIFAIASLALSTMVPLK